MKTECHTGIVLISEKFIKNEIKNKLGIFKMSTFCWLPCIACIAMKNNLLVCYVIIRGLY